MFYEELVQFLKQQREQLGYSFREMERRSGVDRKIIVNMENSTTRVTSPTLQKLCSALGLEFELIPEQYIVHFKEQ